MILTRQRQIVLLLGAAQLLFAARAFAAPVAGRIDTLAPYLEKVKALVKSWHEDARLYQVTVEAEADGSLLMENLVSGDNLKGRKVTAYFHSASAAKRHSFVLNGGTGDWVDYVEEPAPANEAVPVIPENAPEWSQAMEAVRQQSGSRVLGRFENGSDATLMGVLVGTWDAARRTHGWEWQALVYKSLPDDKAESTEIVAVRGDSKSGVARADALSERINEEQPGDFSLLAGKEGQKQSVTELTTLGRLPPEGEGVGFEVTPDCRHWAYVANGERAENDYVGKGGADLRVVVDGVASGPFNRIGPIAMSRHGGHVAYTARRGPQWYLVRDGSEYPVGEVEDDSTLGWRKLSPVWLSDDGLHWAFVLTQARVDEVDGWYIEDALYVDGTLTTPVLRRAPGKNATSEERSAAYDLRGVWTFNFSPDGTSWALVHEGIGGARMVEKGKPPTEAFTKVFWPLRFTPQGKLLWVSFDGEKSTLWRDGSAAGNVSGEASIIEISPNEERVALSVTTDGGDAIHVLGGAASVTFEAAEWLEYFVFSPDSKRCAAVDLGIDAKTLIVDGDIVNIADKMSPPAFLKDGRLVYGAQSEGKAAVLVVGDQETPTQYDEIEWIEITDSGAIVYVGLAEVESPDPKAMLVVDGVVVEAVSELRSERFFPDGSAVYEARLTTDGPRVPCFRGVEQPAAPLLREIGSQEVVINSGFKIDGADAAHYIALLKDGRVAAATVHPPRDRPAAR